MSGAERPLAERLRLVVITDPGLARPRSIFDVVEEALRAGAPAIQLRDKGATARELARSAAELRALTRAAGALLFVNDRLDVALSVGADGVHVGPDDIPVHAVRTAVPDGFLVGSSTDDPVLAQRLVAAGADYLGCGTVYETSSKPDAGSVIGLDRLDEVARAVEVPVVGIGGVTVERAPAIARTAASGVAAIRAVMAADDVDGTVRALLAPWPRRRHGPGA